MTLVLSTYSPENDLVEVVNDYVPVKKGLNLMLSDLWSLDKKEDVFVMYIDENLVLNLSLEELTASSYVLAESSLDKLWENEDDDYWASY